MSMMVLHISAYAIRCIYSPFPTIFRRFVIRALGGDDILEFRDLTICPSKGWHRDRNAPGKMLKQRLFSTNTTWSDDVVTALVQHWPTRSAACVLSGPGMYTFLVARWRKLVHGYISLLVLTFKLSFIIQILH